MLQAAQRDPSRPEARADTRPGPRPLALHLLMAQGLWTSSQSACLLWNSASLPWRPELAKAADALKAKFDACAPPDAILSAIELAARTRASDYLRGIRLYRDHPYRRRLADPPTVWRAGTTRLLHFRPRGPERAVVLAIPSLVNRAYILDLAPRASLMRWLAGQGVRGFMVDWDAPGEEELGFELTDYVMQRLDPMIEVIRARCGRRPILLGYCMGGLLAAALAQRRGGEVAGLSLLATPWDFHAGHDPHFLAHMSRMARPYLSRGQPLPVDLLQCMFLGLDPWLALRKFSRFAKLDPNGASARAFVALEDWLNDGVPLAPRVADDAVDGWYGHNTPAAGGWEIDGEAINPSRITVPTLAMIPAGDRIVPPESGMALVRAIDAAEVQRPPLGHIGMVVSGRAKAQVWKPLAAWILQQSA